MPLIPDAVRFHFARQAPSPWNWYTKPDFAGCALSWSAPEGNVALYIVFRCSENLPSDCCEDLLAGHYDDIVERIDIFKPITRLVDDEIHDKNRYLVLAKLDNEDLVWIQDVESTQFTGAAPGETWTYWSNPYGDSPKIKDPCRLDYSTIRVGTFCGFEWDYPSQYPDFVGFDLIVCDVPYSPHTGAESDIEAYRAVLSGKRGMTYSLDRFVNTVIDNESFANRFWYYALLVRLPDSGRVQIPLRHISEPFEKGKPFQYLKARPSWGEGRDRMMAAYARWKAQDNAPKQAPAIETAATPQEEPAESCDLEFFQHAPTLELDNFIAKPNMIGIQFRAMLTEGTKVFAIRATHPLDPTYCAEILRKAQDAPNVREPDCDVFAFCPNNGYMLLIDDNCHDRSWYAFATYDEDSDQFVELTHVKDTTIDFLTNANEAVSWGNTHLKFENHVLHCFKLEEISKKNVLSLEFGIIDESAVTSIELYRFDEPPVQDMDHLDDFHLFQQTGAPKLGERFVIDHVCPGIIDDVSSCDAVHYYAAVSVDKNQNRFPLSVFSQGNQERESWERLSDICRQSPSLPQDLPNSMEIKSLSESDIISAAISDISEISGPREQVSTNHPASTGDDIETAGTNILNVDNLGVHKRISKRKFSWDDESDLDDVSSQTDDDSETNISNRDNLNIHNRISKRTYSSEKESVRTDASDDISEDETHTHIANISKDINRKVSAKSRYSWDDDISAGSSDSSNSENAGTNVFSIDQFGIHKRIPTPLPDDTELADDNEFEETNIASIHDHNVHKRISKRKYSWDDDISDSESNTPMTGDEEDYETNIVRVNHLGSRKPASSSVESDSSRSVNESRDVFVVEKKYETVDDDMNSDDEDSSGITKIYSRRTFSWDDDEPERNDNRQELREERDNSDQSENPGVPQDDHSSDDSIHFEEKHISPKNRADTHTHNQRPNVSGTRKRFSWDDEALNDSETEQRPEEFHRSQENSSVDHNEESRPGISGARRRFSWDDETPNNEPKSENSRSSREFAAIEHNEETRSSASDINSISGARRRFQWDDEPIESSHKSEDNSGNLDNNVSTSGARRRFSWDGNEQSSNEEKSGNHSVSRDNNQSSGARRRFSWDDETPNDSEPKSENSRSSREYSAIEQHEETRSSSNGISSLGGARRRFSWDDETTNDGGQKSEDSQSSREYSAIEQHEETRSSTNGISSLGGARRRFSWDDETPNDSGQKSEDSRSSREYSAIEQHEETRSSTNGISSLGGARRRFSWDDETPNDSGQKSEDSRSSRESSAIEHRKETRSSVSGISSISGTRKRFSWDDETPNDDEKSENNRSSREYSAIEHREENRSSVSGISSVSGARKRFSWDDDEEPKNDEFLNNNQSSEANRASRETSAIDHHEEIHSRISKKYRFSWDDDEQQTDDVSENNQNSEENRSEHETSDSEHRRKTRSNNSKTKHRFSWDDDEPQTDDVLNEEASEASINLTSSGNVSDENKQEAERLEKERLEREEAERLEKERLEREEAERLEKERLEKEEAERLERERLEREEAERLEKERLEREEAERLERERLEREEAERLERERLEREEAERLERERLEREEAERLERERLEREEAERLERERLEREEAERLERERLEREEAERLERERLEREEAERLERERLEREEAERLERERLEREEAERLERERLERERQERERREREEAERRAREEFERKVLEEARRLAEEESLRLKEEQAQKEAQEESEKQAKLEAEKLAREEAEKQAKEKAERLVNEDPEVIALLARCRQSLEDGDLQEAFELIERSKKSYPDNLRIQAFAWNYLK